MSRQSTRVVKTSYASSTAGGGYGGNVLSGGIGSGLSVNSGAYGAGRSSIRYANSVSGFPSRQMSYAVSTRYGGVGASAGSAGGFGFGSSSYGAGGLMGGGAQITPVISNVQVNSSLLTPVTLDLDPTIHDVRTREKEQIKGLNNRFAGMIDRVSNASRAVCDQQKCTTEVYFYHFI